MKRIIYSSKQRFHSGNFLLYNNLYTDLEIKWGWILWSMNLEFNVTCNHVRITLQFKAILSEVATSSKKYNFTRV
jgi:hypothetical protein